MGGASAFHRPVTKSRRDTDRQIEGQRHTIKACDLLVGPGMLVTAYFDGPKNGHSLCRWGTGKEVGQWGRGEAGRAGIFRQPNLGPGQSLRGRAKCPRVKHEEWHLLATSLHPASELQGVWAPPHCVGRTRWRGYPRLWKQSHLHLKSHIPASTHREVASVLLTETAQKPKQQPGFGTGLEREAQMEPIPGWAGHLSTGPRRGRQ